MPESPPSRCSNCGTLKKGPCPNGCDSWAGRPSGNWQRKHDRRWDKLRALRLAISPDCEFCNAKATQVDHMDGTDYRDNSGEGASWLNLEMTRSLCDRCHQQRTAAQSAAARRKKESDGI